MIAKRISKINEKQLFELLDFLCKECNIIYLTEISIDRNKDFLSLFESNLIKSKKVKKWDGTILGKVPKEFQSYVLWNDRYAIRHKIICNFDTIEIIKKYSKQLLNVYSDFDMAFYNNKECYMFTTAHENYMCIKKDL